MKVSVRETKLVNTTVREPSPGFRRGHKDAHAISNRAMLTSDATVTMTAKCEVFPFHVSESLSAKLRYKT